MNERSDLASLRELIRDSLGDPLKEFFLDEHFKAIPEWDTEAWAVVDEETAPVQARATFHIEGGSIDGHAGPARKIVELVNEITLAASELADQIRVSTIGESGKDKRDFLLAAIRPGSVMIEIQAPPPAEEAENEPTVPLIDEPTVKTQALFRVVEALAVAGAPESETNPFTDMPSATRRHLRKVVKIVQNEEWICGMRAVRRRQKAVSATLDKESGEAVLRMLSKLPDEPRLETLEVTLDGFRSSTGSLYVKTASGNLTLKVPDKDSELFIEAKRLAASETRARVVVNVEPGRDDKKDQYTLWQIDTLSQPLPRQETEPLFAG